MNKYIEITEGAGNDLKVMARYNLTFLAKPALDMYADMYSASLKDTVYKVSIVETNHELTEFKLNVLWNT